MVPEAEVDALGDGVLDGQLGVGTTEAQQVFRLERKHVSDCRLCIKVFFYLTVVLRTQIRPFCRIGIRPKNVT